MWTATGRILADHDVRLERGRIAAVGRALPAKGATRVIDARGKHLTPGMIDPHSHMGVYPVPSLRAHSDGNEIARPMSPEVRARDGFWPQDPAISRALAAGVTTAQILPGSANLVGGRGIILKLAPGRSAMEMRFPGAPTTIKMACGENPKRVYGRRGGPRTRMGNVARLRKMLQRAVKYRRDHARYLRKLAAWSKKRTRVCGGPPTRSSQRHSASRGSAKLGKRPTAPKRDIALETLAGVLDGSIKVHWHCYRADDMLSMLSVAREFGFRVQAFHHAVEAYKIRDVLARVGTAVVTWVDWWGFKIEAYDAIQENAPLLQSSGALVSLHSDSPQVIQRYNIEAARAYTLGRAAGLRLSRARALDVVTINAARVLGVDRYTGSIEVGKHADVVLWSGDPLSVYSRVEQVFVDGHLRFTRKRGRRSSDFELGMVPRPAPLASAAPSRTNATKRPAAAAAAYPWYTPPWPRAKAARVTGAGVVAVVGARVHTLTGPPLLGATVVAKDGVITAVGKGIKVPSGARTIDGRGKILTPGLFAAISGVGLVDIGLEPSARQDHLRGKRLPYRPIRAALRAVDGLDLNSNVIGVVRAAGFTSAVARPRGGLINGQGVAFDLAGVGGDSDLRAPVAIFGVLGARSARQVGSRAAALGLLRAALADTRWLARNRARATRGPTRKLAASQRDLRALAPVVTRRLPLVLHVDRAADIVRALAFAKRERIRLVIAGAAEGWRVAQRIAAAKVPVLINVDANLPRSFDALGARFDNAARLARAGVLVGFSSGGRTHHVRKLRQLAGVAVARGLPHESALAALTAVPARIFGLQHKGVIRVGARANLVLWSGDPFETSTTVSAVILGGKQRKLTSRQALLRERYRKLPAR